MSSFLSGIPCQDTSTQENTKKCPHILLIVIICSTNLEIEQHVLCLGLRRLYYFILVFTHGWTVSLGSTRKEGKHFFSGNCLCVLWLNAIEGNLQGR